jgi:Tfp pilus assembly protein PilO
MPVALLLLLGIGVVAGGYALAHSDSDGENVKRKAAPKRLTEQLPANGPATAKLEALKGRIETLKKKAEQGDKDAGKSLEALKTLWGNLRK